MNSRSRCIDLALLLLLATACTREAAPAPVAEGEPELLRALEGKTALERAELILQAAESGDARQGVALLRLMKDRSQVAFLAERDSSRPFGWKAVEFKDTGPDTRSMERVAAIAGLGRLGCRAALPDLLLALDDRHPVVANHAAAVLVQFGSRAGVPLLLMHLEGRNSSTGEFMASPAFAGETADELLRGLTQKDAGYNVDAGARAKGEAVARWRGILAAMEQAGERFRGEGRILQPGEDAELDRRIRFHVDVLGEMQFLYHEQARRLLQRLGVAALPYVREGIERMTGGGNTTGLAGLAQVLGAIAHPNSEGLLLELMKSPHGTVASRAAESLGKLATPGAVAALGAALVREDLCLAALAALGRSGDKGARSLREFKSADGEAMKLRTLALFEATGGREARDESMALLMSASVADRNRGLEVVKRVLGSDEGFFALAPEAERSAALERLKKRLP